MSAFHDNALMGASGSQGYTISRSVRLRSSASAYLNRTPATAGNRRTWTWSGWVKRGRLSVTNYLFSAPSTSSSSIFFSGVDRFHVTGASGAQFNLETTSVYRDISAWYHIVVALDTTQATSTDRLKIYVNGNQLTAFASATYPSLNLDGEINNNIFHQIGRPDANTHDGYMTEINFIDGQALTPSSFGETNALTGVWQPKRYTGTYGTNGFYLNFSDNSGVTATTIGKDYSGNGNNWTPNNISVTAGVTYDSMLDVPTQWADGGNGRGNYCTLNPLAKGPQFTVTDGNLRTGNATVGNYHQSIGSTIAVNTGKWYWEIASNGTIYNSRSLGIAFAGDLTTAGDNPMWNTTTQLKNYRAILLANSTTVTPVRAIAGTVSTATNITLPVTLTGSNTFMVAIDISAGAIWFGVDGTWLKSATTAEIIAGTTTNAVYTDIGSPSDLWTPALYNYLGAATGYGWIANFGQRPFAYTPPTGFVALNTQNLPTPTISNGALYMAATLYAANGSTQTISNAVNGVSMQPDFVWVKSRQYTTVGHSLFDALRPIGVNSSLPRLVSNSTDAETNNGGLTAFVSNGFSLNNDAYINSTSTGGNMVAWQWNAGGSTVTNTSGSISAQVRANATAGFSVVTYTGTGVAATIGHGLGVAPSMMIIKSRPTASTSWIVYHSSISPTNLLTLQTTAAQQNLPLYFNSTAPTSSVFSIGSAANTGTDLNVNGSTYVAYCFAAVAGYSAFGKYTGNGSTDGVFVYLGFRARFLMIKRTDSTGGWVMLDTARDTYNDVDNYLYANSSAADAGSSNVLDINSNGFKIRNSWTDINASGGTYVYMAFCENPLKLSLAR